MKLDRLSEQQIQSAIRRGEFDKLKGAGKPFSESQIANASVEGFGYKTMADAGVVPDEIKIKKEIARLMPELTGEADPEKCKTLMAELADLQTRLGILEEARKKYMG